jgi:hypothetical protein
LILENFQTSASYFMCYFTLQRVNAFKHFPCEDREFREDFADYRAEHETPFGCAELSFCPGKLDHYLHRMNSNIPRRLSFPLSHRDLLLKAVG